MRRTVLVLSDHVVFRHGAIALVRGNGLSVSEQAATAPLRGKRPDVAVIDLDHLSIDTRTFLGALGQQLAETFKVAVGTTLRLGASAGGLAEAELEVSRLDTASLAAACNKRPPASSPELARVHRTWAQVTARQRDVLRWLAHGLDNPTIGLKLRVGARAIKAHISALLALFGVDNRTQLALLAHDGGLRSPMAR